MLDSFTSYTPDQWFWVVGDDVSRAWSSAAGGWVDAWPDDAVTRIASEEDLCDVLRSLGLSVPAPSAQDVKAEAQRRIVLLTGAVSLEQCLIKQLNALMRATELTNKRATGGALTSSEEAEAAALQALADAIKHIRARADEIEALSPIPLDYTSDSYWQ